MTGLCGKPPGQSLHYPVRHTRAACLAVLTMAILLLPRPVPAQEAVEIQTIVEDRDIYLGERFFYLVKVSGGEKVGRPDVSGFKDFDVREVPVSWIRSRGGSRWENFNLEEGTSFIFRLVPLGLGNVTIPPAPIEVDGSVYKTAPIPLRITEPPRSDDFKLLLSLTKKEVYVGEPVVLRAVWYFRKKVRFYTANIPILRHPSFNPEASAGNTQLTWRSYGSSQNWSGKEGTELLGGFLYDTVTFEKALIPRDPGRFDFIPATVQVWMPMEAENNSSQESAPGSRWNSQSLIIGSQRLSIRVLSLPLQGRPSNFSGIVAEDVRISVSVIPSEMNVGDPVTLNLTLSGPLSVEDVEIPPLDSQAELASGFSVRSEAMKTQVGEAEKTFSQTIRVKSEEVGEVPALEIPYFNTRIGAYQVARSKPVPLTVKPTRIVTSEDLEGEELAAVSATNVREWEEGIRYNYRGTAQLLSQQPYVFSSLMGKPLFPVILAISMSGLIAVLVFDRRRRTRERILAYAERNPEPKDTAGLPRLTERLEKLQRENHADQWRSYEGLSAWREYLGVKLGLPPGRFIWKDIAEEIRRQGIDETLLREAKDLFDLYELASYSGRSGVPGGEGRSLFDRIIRVASELDKGGG